MTRIKILACDVGFRAFGMASFWLDLDTLDLELIKTRLVTTESETTINKRKVVRTNSDDLRRAKVTWDGFSAECADVALVFAEVPSGAQSARAALGFGMQIGILGCCPRPIIQVMPSETKEAAIGTKKNVEKADIIAWAAALYPDAGWKLYDRATKLHAKGSLHESNEHEADACAIAHAGILTDEFRRTRAIWRSSPLLAAA